VIILNYIIKPAAKIKLIIKLTVISELELRMEERLRGILMNFRELNKKTRFACMKGNRREDKGDRKHFRWNVRSLMGRHLVLVCNRKQVEVSDLYEGD